MTRNGPALWDALLDAVNVPGAVVAGGCIRDHLLKLEPKDIDIFVPLLSRLKLRALGEDLNSRGLFDLHMIEPGDADHAASDGDGVPDLIGVLDGEGLGVPVNIIARIDHKGGVEALLDGFDFHVLRAEYSDGEIGYGEHMRDDIESRTATLAHQRSPDISKARFERFNERNPGVLKFVDHYTLDDDFAFDN